MRRSGILQSLPVLIAFVAGGYLSYLYFRCPPEQVEEESTILMTQMQSVTKLITVEGFFSEIYDYNAYQGYWTWLYDKKILVRARGKVSVGYDLKNLKMEADPSKRIIYIGPLPGPEILSIDHELDYYDIREGIFTEFSAAEYNKINEKAKDLIKQKAEQSPLFDAADEQANEMIEMMRFIAESSGWTVEVRGRGQLIN